MWRRQQYPGEAVAMASAAPAFVADERYVVIARPAEAPAPAPRRYAAAPRTAYEAGPYPGSDGFAAWQQPAWQPAPRGRIAGYASPWQQSPRGFAGGGGSVVMASYYSGGGRTASGERVGTMTAAHRSLPFGTMVRVTNMTNGSTVVVRINDRGPFVRNRGIDLSSGAARAIGMTGAGVARVRMDVI